MNTSERKDVQHQENHPHTADAKTTWRQTLGEYARPLSLRMLALGFAAGLPLPLVMGTLSFRLREQGVELATISMLSWVGLAYAFKWAWSPLVDRLRLPGLGGWLGQRRSWMLLSQLTIVLGLLGMAGSSPTQSLAALVGWAVVVAAASATQDIALDAWRIESASARGQGVLAAMYQSGYRLALIWAGAGALWLRAEFGASIELDAGKLAADAASSAYLGATAAMDAAWLWAYAIMAASMAVGVVTVLCAPRPPAPVLEGGPAVAGDEALPQAGGRGALRWLRETVVQPFAVFARRWGPRALVLLALIALYRISDIVMGSMANAFYVDMGFNAKEVASVTKIFGLIMTLLGGFVGGALVARWGVMRILMLGAILSAASNLLFAWLAVHGHDIRALAVVVSVDNLSAGISSAAFVAYMSGLTDIRYSATQYAMLSSVMLLLPKLLAGYSGVFVQHYGYVKFFVGTAILGLPVLALAAWAAKVHARDAAHRAAAAASAAQGAAAAAAGGVL